VNELNACGFLTDNLRMSREKKRSAASAGIHHRGDSDPDLDSCSSYSGSNHENDKNINRRAIGDSPSSNRETHEGHPQIVWSREGRATYMGVCRLPPVQTHGGDSESSKPRLHRRIDLKSYRRVHFPFALLYFTGPDHFNRCVRCACCRTKRCTDVLSSHVYTHLTIMIGKYMTCRC
jgi:hypothetical protein